MLRERAIIHLNVADFAVAVEQSLDAKLRGRPLIIAEPGATRARVFDMSETAYRAGVRKGMRLSHAQSLSRDLRVLPLRLDRYARAMHSLAGHARPYSPQIEQPDRNGHLFVDVTGTGRLWGPPPDVAWRMRKSVRAAMGLDPIWALATNKLVAKVATRLVKPAGEYIVEAGDEAAFLKPIPMRLFPGLHPQTLARLKDFHLWHAGEVAHLSLAQLEAAVGKQARRVYDLVRGVDPAPVLDVDRAQDEITHEHEFADDTTDAARIDNELYRLADRLGGDLRARKTGARRLTLHLAYSDGVTAQRQVTFAGADDHTPRLYAAARTLLEAAWQRRIRLRHLQLTGSCLAAPVTQLDLFATPADDVLRGEKLMAAMDRIRDRFGHEAIAVAHAF
ncbi:MAG TPA: hypothetical protein VL860_10750 [Planctomycetota bacterium]|nr:hypothetical protein [Planctomycetota bacterium]